MQTLPHASRKGKKIGAPSARSVTAISANALGYLCQNRCRIRVGSLEAFFAQITLLHLFYRVTDDVRKVDSCLLLLTFLAQHTTEGMLRVQGFKMQGRAN